MPMGLPAYDCDPNTGICGGGFGGANDIRSRVGAGPSGASGYAWGAYNVPLFEGYVPRLREPDVPVGSGPVSSGQPQTADGRPLQETTQTMAQVANGSQQAAGSNFIAPALIILAALVFGK